MRYFIRMVPKAELHVHVEGTLEPELMLALAARNGLPPPFPSAAAARAAYSNFTSLQSFLDLYYLGCSVLRTQRDYYDLAMAYFKRAASEGVIHAEVFFDPQTHLSNGVWWSTFMPGLAAAAEDARTQLGLSAAYIMCFRKEMSAADADEVLTEALAWRQHVVAVGLDSSELGNPPSKFKAVFERAAAMGYRRVAHAGEEGPPEYIWEAIRLLRVSRVDHGVHAVEDPALLSYLAASRLPLTVCPVSNLKLKVYDGQLPARLGALLRSGAVVTVNSDDAAYFGAYIADNYEYLAQIAGLGLKDIAQLALNSFEASFLLPPASASTASTASSDPATSASTSTSDPATSASAATAATASASASARASTLATTEGAALVARAALRIRQLLREAEAAARAEGLQLGPGVVGAVAAPGAATAGASADA